MKNVGGLVKKKAFREGKSHFDCDFPKGIQESNRHLNPTVSLCKIKLIYLGNMIWPKVLARKASMWVCNTEQTRQEMERMPFSECLSAQPGAQQHTVASSLIPPFPLLYSRSAER